MNGNKKDACTTCADLRKQVEDRDRRLAHAKEGQYRVGDWIENLAHKDNGKIFLITTDEDDAAPVTYGDLRRLMALDATPLTVEPLFEKVDEFDSSAHGPDRPKEPAP